MFRKKQTTGINTNIYVIFLCFVAFIFFQTGCQTDSQLAVYVPFNSARTDTIPGILTPSERIEMVRLKGENGRLADSQTQKMLIEHLTKEYVDSPDPVLRQEVVKAMERLNNSDGFALFKYAAMKDENPFVRRAACRAVASIPQNESAAVLRHIIRHDADKDVQLQAIKSLAAFDDQDTITALGELLESRHAALRYQAIQSLKSCTRQNYGDDVRRWKQYLAGQTPNPPEKLTFSQRLGWEEISTFK
ncbi:MAG: HEAT repeat domain-containing protein [Planctomycetaceae bacterium]|jgi:hypothetical protein|nr:HEAT repeat domain-containing protein [Planctomycetaceae bacterium]